MSEEWNAQLRALGEFIRAQRTMANLSLRQAADLAEISNPYLSQLERGLHEPSVRVLRLIARALDISAETLLQQIGFFPDAEGVASPPTTETAIRADPQLSDEQKRAMLAVYRSYVDGADHA